MYEKLRERKKNLLTFYQSTFTCLLPPCWIAEIVHDIPTPNNMSVVIQQQNNYVPVKIK